MGTVTPGIGIKTHARANPLVAKRWPRWWTVCRQTVAVLSLAETVLQIGEDRLPCADATFKLCSSNHCLLRFYPTPADVMT